MDYVDMVLCVWALKLYEKYGARCLFWAWKRIAPIELFRSGFESFWGD